MNELYLKILEKINSGAVVVNYDLKIAYWNCWLVKYTGINSDKAIGSKLYEIMPNLNKNYYNQILKNALINGQSMFCSGGLHPIFINPLNNANKSLIKQNLQIDPIILDGEKFILLQITDITNQFKRVKALKNEISNRKKAEDRIKKELKEKETLLKEIHHRVKNNLQTISSILSLQGSKIVNEDMLAIFTDAQNRVKAMALVHEKLYGHQSLEYIDLEDHIKELVDNLILSLPSYEKYIKTNFEIDKTKIKLDQAIPLSLIINEIITNSLKHAFKNKKRGQIFVKSKLCNNRVIFSIKDDGEGIPANQDIQKAETLGWQLIKLLTEDLEGKYKVFSDEGTEIRICFPLN